MGAMASQITILKIVYSSVYSRFDGVSNSWHVDGLLNRLYSTDPCCQINYPITPSCFNQNLFCMQCRLRATQWVIYPWQRFILQWLHSGRAGVWNYHPHDCLLKRLLRRRSKKALKLHITDLCAGNSPVTGEFPAQMTNNAENVSIWWHHHEITD